MKVLLDTNVLASAFTTRGLCSDVLSLIVKEHQLVTGEVVLKELKTVLTTKFKMPHDTVLRIDSFLRDYEVISAPAKLPSLKLRDQNDVRVIASAINAQAAMVVTGDGEMLNLENKPIPILSPREF